tara:strand:+ start:103 stop:294 length:192 start_codon:yes stop_codon:yes gene_type:complete
MLQVIYGGEAGLRTLGTLSRTSISSLVFISSNQLHKPFIPHDKTRTFGEFGKPYFTPKFTMKG